MHGLIEAEFGLQALLDLGRQLPLQREGPARSGLHQQERSDNNGEQRGDCDDQTPNG
ncbi:MAG: hypothetical protein NVV62_06310 [Terricaulis sp.]|nr:hypothetical protein [Terricaulis sp.]